MTKQASLARFSLWDCRWNGHWCVCIYNTCKFSLVQALSEHVIENTWRMCHNSSTLTCVAWGLPCPRCIIWCSNTGCKASCSLWWPPLYVLKSGSWETHVHCRQLLNPWRMEGGTNQDWWPSRPSSAHIWLERATSALLGQNYLISEQSCLLNCKPFFEKKINVNWAMLYLHWQASWGKKE